MMPTTDTVARLGSGMTGRESVARDRLPDKLRSVVAARMRRAYHAESALAAEAELSALAAELDKHPSRRGGQLARGHGRDAHRTASGRAPDPGSHAAVHECDRVNDLHLPHSRENVKRWRDGQMALRWCAAGMVEAGKQFRRVNGHMHLRSLRDTLEKVTETVAATRHDEDRQCSLMITGPPPKFHETRDILDPEVEA